MRSTRLAILAVGVGATLLGWSAAGVTAVADNLPFKSSSPCVEHHGDHRSGGDRRGEDGV
jgi:hypothetical protein